MPSASADSFSLSDFDKQSHLIIAFQAAATGTAILEDFHFSKSASIALGFSGTLALAFAKETLVDSYYDPNDIWAGLLGSSLGALAMMIGPDAKNGVTLEPEGGLVAFSPITGTGLATTPPSSLMIEAQTTFWLRPPFGLHLFSGGLELGGIKNGTSKKLLFGGGFRVRIPSRPFSVWAGMDYGYLLFATDDLVVPYLAASYAPFYSAGLSWKPWKAPVHVGAQTTLVAYGSNLLIAPGVQAGFEF